MDTCDRCGHRAYVETAHKNGNLSWCLHHYKQYVKELLHRVVRERLMELA